MPKKARSSTARLRGTVRAFNVSPKGRIEGALIETAKGIVQLNFPKHDPDARAASLKLDAAVDLAVELETDKHAHAVYRALDEGAHGHAQGKVVRLNHARHGEVNGVHLDDGTFVHLGPEAAARHRVRVGDSVIATGTRRPGPDAVVLEARSIKRTAKHAARA